MQTFVMFIRKQDLDFIQGNNECVNITILKSTHIQDDYYEVEIMCDDIGILFVAGEHKGCLETLVKYEKIIKDMSTNFNQVLSKLNELTKAIQP